MAHPTRSILIGLLMLVSVGLLAAGCGDNSSKDTKADSKKAAKSESEDEKMMESEAMPSRLTTPAKQVTLQVDSSEFGDVLFDGNGQAVYAFENDTKGVSNCSGDCADFWPPVLTESDATAGTGADKSLLGTITREDGATQVTYNGLPLYFVNEPADEIHCQNADMHGGLWWVVTAEGAPVKAGKSKM